MATRRQLEGMYARLTTLCQQKNGEALAALVREVTTPDFRVKGIDGRPIRWSGGAPLTRELLLRDYPKVAREPLVADYAVERTSIRIDKLVVLGDIALVLTSGEGAGSLTGRKAGYGDVERPWSSLNYRD